MDTKLVCALFAFVTTWAPAQRTISVPCDPSGVNSTVKSGAADWILPVAAGARIPSRARAVVGSDSQDSSSHRVNICVPPPIVDLEKRRKSCRGPLGLAFCTPPLSHAVQPVQRQHVRASVKERQVRDMANGQGLPQRTSRRTKTDGVNQRGRVRREIVWLPK
jgi:hypothetical protein